MESLVELCRWRAAEDPDRQIYSFLGADEAEVSTLSRGQLDRRARAVAAVLQSVGANNDRVLLVFPPGLDFVIGFLGCLYAGAVAVPIPLPRFNRRMDHLMMVAEDSQTGYVLTTRSILNKVDQQKDGDPRSMVWLAIEDIDLSLAGDWLAPRLNRETLAFLQYTSGSTMTPRGVMVTHGNLLHNEELIQHAFNQTDESVILSWLPLYHDMGLIGSVLQTAYLGARCILMSPLAFLQRPLRWLWAISKYGVSTSGGPDFAYELCVRQADQGDLSSVNLSNWSVAFNGSEPIRPQTINRFVAAFEPFGFRRDAFSPCYGLAEATLLVSGGNSRSEPLVMNVLPESLNGHRVLETESGEQGGHALAASGRVQLPQRVIIADPQTLTRLSGNEVGEIWLTGPCVAAGYYNRLEETTKTFRAYLADSGDGPFLRTGDLGFVKDGELFVTGRLKDLMIFRGQNYYPADIETTVQRLLAPTRQQWGTAFSIVVAGEDRLVIVQEISGPHARGLDEIIDLIRQSVAEEHGLPAYAVALVRPGTVPRTSSGKVRRLESRDQFIEGKLRVLADWREPSAMFDVSSGPASIPTTVAEAELWLACLLAERLGVSAGSVDVTLGLSRYGLDSVRAVDLGHVIEKRLGITLSMNALLCADSITQLAETIVVLLTGPPSLVPDPRPSAEDLAEFDLSAGQQALYFLHQLADAPINNIAAAGRIPGAIDAIALRAALQSVVDRHPSLRTNFVQKSAGLRQRVKPGQAVHFQETDATQWTAETLTAVILEESNRRFDLEYDQLLRVTIYKRNEESWILLVVHHIVSDLWSLGLLAQELGAYLADDDLRQIGARKPPECLYSDFVRRQAEMLAGPEGDRLSMYWEQKLSGDLSALDLPTDRLRPPLQTFTGGVESLRLPTGLADRLARLSQTCKTTLFTILAAAFQSLLHRYTGQNDILLGTIANGRSSARFADVIGYFVNPLVLRGDFSGGPAFSSIIVNMRKVMIEALDHQDYPFSVLADKLQRVRDASRAPLVQAMFFYQSSHLVGQEWLTQLAVGGTEAGIKIGEMQFEVVPLGARPTQFDLTLKLAAVSGIQGLLEYNADLFEPSTIKRFLQHFEVLIEEGLQHPEIPITNLLILPAVERSQVLVEWNDTDNDSCPHEFMQTSFEGQTRRTPDAIAVSFQTLQVTYDSLNARANRLAHRLRKLGVGPETRVAVCIPRSAEIIVAVLGILKAGGAYLPLDPAFPHERLSLMVRDAGAAIIVTSERTSGSLPRGVAGVLRLDPDNGAQSRDSVDEPVCHGAADNLAYLIYTSGSTGSPKGVMVSHRNVVNFFYAMDARLGCQHPGTWLAVTSISFDISILELLWTVSRGFQVVVEAEPEAVQHRDFYRGSTRRELEFSLFYFASDDREAADDRYNLLFEGAKFADEHGFSAVWTPERHFHPFGGLYPNPAVTGAALAAITRNVKIRAGSVVLPLHNPIRVAEEWSVVDNISKGRVGISVASGWHADDFILAPDRYADRKSLMLRYVDIVRRLWSGESVSFEGGAGNEVTARVFPRPIQTELPLWITSAGNLETFQVAGETGANLLTHLLGQDLETLRHKISVYREAFQAHGHGPGSGCVTLMVHTFIGDDIDEVKARVKAPFCEYLRSSYGLVKNLARSLNIDVDSDVLAEDDMQALLDHGFDRYFGSSGLMGTLDTCGEMVERIRDIGVDELACLIDFGLDKELVLRGLKHLDVLKNQTKDGSLDRKTDSLLDLIGKLNITHLQCTPSMARLLGYGPESFSAFGGLRQLLLGGEALPITMAREVGKTGVGEIYNMYGPTETTIWSTADRVDQNTEDVTIGRPIENTRSYILDRNLEPVPIGVPGALHIGGMGVVRGYVNSPDITAERFLPDPFCQGLGSRLYVAGDLARYHRDGRIEFIGRADHQVKLRGYRVELEEVECALNSHPAVGQAAVLVEERMPNDARLVAYVVLQKDQSLSLAEVRHHLKLRLPEYMIPSALVILNAIPLTPNGKISRRDLLAAGQESDEGPRTMVTPRGPLEQVLASMWADLLGVEVGIHDDFFERGGHSILAAQLMARLRETFEIEFPLRTFFSAPTVAGMAAALSANPQQQKRVDGIAKLLISVLAYTEGEVDALLDEDQIAT